MAHGLTPISVITVNLLIYSNVDSVKIIVTRWQILMLKCTKFDVGWGSAPDPAGGAYSAPPDHLAGFKGPYF